MIKNKLSLLLLSALLTVIGNGFAQTKSLYPKHEFRGVWIATVVNIDWPKSGNDPIVKQKEDYIKTLEAYQKLNFNAVIVQLRSVGDAFYPSELAPWSRFLTGKEGEASEDYKTMLEWMISEAHTRGFEFHAWLNPYRATFDLNKTQLSPQHDVNKHPEWMIKYGTRYYYDPSLPEVQEHLTKIVEEVLVNYDIDAIHFDDYFYPYKTPGEVFNDAESFMKYGNGMLIEDWRRSNVTSFVKKIHDLIQNQKPWVQFGISPFGVWRNKSVDPKGSDTRSGQTNYDDLYADPLLWMNNKWIDYLVPQLYWSIDHKTVSYSKLLKWWTENTQDVNLYMGNAAYKIKADSDKKWDNIHEIANQIDLTRAHEKAQGNVFFSAKSIINTNKEVVELLQNHQYKYPALPPVPPRLKHIVIDTPVLENKQKDSANYHLTIKMPLNTKVRYVMVYGATNDSKIDSNKPQQILKKQFVAPKTESIQINIPCNNLIKINTFAITFIDLYGNESKESVVEIPN
ncbi:glycoside hydrolase family 10 protein [Flavobacterium sp. TSSA_36]|uniref:glycoside hydrolase family 10 protein n=1 Tax=Flavobacterium sp. TSSA_36 TaxID=3447669 RepID=UPI003F2AB835